LPVWALPFFPAPASKNPFLVGCHKIQTAAQTSSFALSSKF
jgi:hypothetical protein